MRALLPADAYHDQVKILVLSWLTYTLAYTLRVNIAVVIPLLVAQQHYTFAQMGFLTSLFFITYMFGQLINGYLGDRVNCKLLIVTGLMVSAFCNIGMAVLPGLTALFFFWGLNGLAQSMLWAPLMKALSVWFAGYQLEKVSFIMAQSMVIGYAVSWGFSSFVSAAFGWIWAFLLPAGLVLIFSFFMILFFQSQPAANQHAEIQNKSQDQSRNNSDQKTPKILASEPDGEQAGEAQKRKQAKVKADDQDKSLSIRSFFRLIQLPGLLLIALFHGLIREGISVWFPTILQESGSFSLERFWLVLVVVPLINFGGVLLVRKVNLRLKSDSFRTLLTVFSLMTAAAFILSLLISRWFLAVLPVMVLLLSLAHGLTPILTSVIPFQLARFKKVSLTVGVLDFAIYLGAAVSSALSGLIADRFTWSGVINMWLVAAAAGFILSMQRYISNKGRNKDEQKIHNSQ